MKRPPIFLHIENRSLAHVMRFNIKPQHFPESVADHSYFVAYIVCILCYLLEEKGEVVDKQKALEMALVHDMEEIFSGDIVTPFKHYSPEVEEAISKVNNEMIPEVFEGLPKKLSEHFIGLWTEEGQEESTESQVVKVADKLSLLAKCAEEVRVGNEFFQEIYDKGVEFLEVYDKSWWQIIKPQVLG
jgi:5'-deoxynucleotidase YfbR-like HD superfamily hydrolase